MLPCPRHTTPGHHPVQRGSSNATWTLQPTTYTYVTCLPYARQQAELRPQLRLARKHTPPLHHTPAILSKTPGHPQTLTKLVVPASSCGFLDCLLHPCTFATKCHIKQSHDPLPHLTRHNPSPTTINQTLTLISTTPRSSRGLIACLLVRAFH